METHHLPRPGAAYVFLGKRYADGYGNREHPGRSFWEEYLRHAGLNGAQHKLFRGGQNGFIRVEDNLARAGGSYQVKGRLLPIGKYPSQQHKLLA